MKKTIPFSLIFVSALLCNSCKKDKTGKIPPIKLNGFIQKNYKFIY